MEDGAGVEVRSQPAKAKAEIPRAVPVMKVLRERRCAGVGCMRVLLVPDLCGLALNGTGLGHKGANLLLKNLYAKGSCCRFYQRNLCVS